ncbi:MAG: MgtC/SapB family protein [Peptostreptococcaceae bacterium]|nr:MgtC/SapB family protein [Peptostreptococcaceae bacterium]
MEELMLLQEHIPKLLLAALIGGIIGLERGNRGGVIGFGTLSTLTLGCTLLTIISAYAIGTDADPSRLISTIISSIGFIGGGVIFTQRNDNEKSVRGLTSASIVFCLAAIGISIGLGYYGIAVVTAILIELNVFISRFIKKRRKENEEDYESEF